MPLSDAAKWNERYHQDRFKSFVLPRPFLVENAGYLPEHGLALDIAMGLGGNAGFLLKHGLRVVGLDISEVAVSGAKSRFPDLMGAVMDLNRFYIPPAQFDVITNFYYLQRELWPIYKKVLRQGGILIYETLTLEMLQLNADIEPEYLLAPGELRDGFQDLEIMVYREGWVIDEKKHSRSVASLVARKTA